MKKIFAVLSVVLVLSLVNGCLKAPDEPVAAGKDSQLEQKILATATPSASATAPQGSVRPSSPAGLPPNGPRIQETLKNKSGTVELTIDAEVKRYDDQTFPAAVVVPQKFSQQQADSIIQAVVGDLKFYSATELSREQINEQIIFYKQRLEKANTKDRKDTINKIIRDYESMLARAAPEGDLSPASRLFSKSNSIPYSQSIVGKFDRGGNTYTLWINNSEDGELSDAALHKVGPGVFSIIGRAGAEEANSPVAIPYGQALDQAQQLVGDIQADLSLDAAFVVVAEPEGNPGEGQRNYAYQFVFTREVNGFHVAYDTSYLSMGGTEEENNASNEQPWPYERLVITVDGKGVQDLDWQGPCKVEAILNDHVAMLPFSETMSVFRQMVFIKNSQWETFVENNEGWSSAVIQIDRITLGLMRVQSQGKYYLIPVWDFYGSVDYVMKDGTRLSSGDAEGLFRDSLSSLLTINAIDGSVIDRHLGY